MKYSILILTFYKTLKTKQLLNFYTFISHNYLFLFAIFFEPV